MSTLTSFRDLRVYQSLSEWHGSVRTGHMVQEDHAEYAVNTDPAWQHAVRITEQIMDESQ